MPEFPKTIYGRCPIGHNMSPSSDTGNNLSTNLIATDEERELVWSDYYQKYVCRTCKRQEQDQIDDKQFTEREKEMERKRQGMGFIKNYSNR